MLYSHQLMDIVRQSKMENQQALSEKSSQASQVVADDYLTPFYSSSDFLGASCRDADLRNLDFE